MKNNHSQNIPLLIGVFASGNGTTLQAIIDACESKKINGKVSFVISNNSNSGAAERAKKHKIPFYHLSGVTHPDSVNLDEAISEVISSHNVDVVFLAGYMKKLGPKTLDRFKGKILNTHPALLPKFGGDGMYGINVHKAVIGAKEKVSGATIHLVDENYDTGKILSQTKVPVKPSDTPEKLAKRVMKAEKKQIIDVLIKIQSGKLKL